MHAALNTTAAIRAERARVSAALAMHPMYRAVTRLRSELGTRWAWEHAHRELRMAGRRQAAPEWIAAQTQAAAAALAPVAGGRQSAIEALLLDAAVEAHLRAE